MLHPELRAPAWTGSVRIAPFLDDAVIAALREEIRAASHELQVMTRIDFAYQYWQHTYVPDEACDHVMCRFGRWLWSDGAAWIADYTGIACAAPPERQVVATHYDKGSFLDPHNDTNNERKVAFVLGLTIDTWPAEEGGWLEFLSSDGVAVSVAERRPPGWNTLDVFDVRAPTRSHAIPIVRRRAERRAISGWLY